MLKITGLKVNTEDKSVIKGINLEVKSGEIHAVMGPNGSGKTTLAYSLMGHPSYEVLGGTATLDRKNLLNMKVDERARSGLFLAFQYPMAVPGVSVFSLLKSMYSARFPDERLPLPKLKAYIENLAVKLQIDKSFLDRNVNEGFSGGEKKRLEILQMAVFKPKYAILDETDSGLDIDALKIVSTGVKQVHKENSTGFLIITHYQRILNYIKPDFVHILKEGKIVKSGDYKLAKELEKKGYKDIV